jgi:hypothetical protein
MNVHLGRQIGFVARGKRSGGGGTSTCGAIAIGAKGLFRLLRAY